MDTGSILVDIFVILVAAKVGAEASERLGQPAVLGEMILGVLIGPSLFGLVESSDVLLVLAELGLLLLLLQVGLETQLGQLLGAGRPAAAVAVTGVVLPVGLALVALPLTGAESDWRIVVFLAAALSATSVGITARVFADLRATGRPEFRTVLGAAVFDDVIGLVILTTVVSVTVVGSITPARLLLVIGAAAAFLVIAAAVGAALVPPVFHWLDRRARSAGTLIALVVALTLGYAELAELSGLAPVVGAFLAGTALARARVRRAAASGIEPIAHVLVPVFFLQIGISADLQTLLRPSVLGLTAVLLAAAVTGKVLSGWAVSRRRGDRLVIGLGMLPRGEVGLVFAALGLREGVLDADAYGALLLVVLATTFVTPPLLRARLRRAPTAEPEHSGGAHPLPLLLGIAEGRVALAESLTPQHTAEAVLRAAVLVEAVPPDRQLLYAAARLGDYDVEWTAELRRALYRLLRQGRRSSWAFLADSGALDALLPELLAGRRRSGLSGPVDWAPLENLAVSGSAAGDPQHSILWQRLDRADLLLLAGLVRSALPVDRTTPQQRRQTARALGGRLQLSVVDRQALAELAELTELQGAGDAGTGVDPAAGASPTQRVRQLLFWAEAAPHSQGEINDQPARAPDEKPLRHP